MAGRKAAAPQTEKNLTEKISIQFAGGEWVVSELKERAIAAYVEEGHRRGNIKKMTFYIKPEEHTVYYVVNEKNSGSVNFS